MYQCVKVFKISKGDKLYWLTKFLDSERAEIFTVYTRNPSPFEVGVSYDLSLTPNFKGFNFLADER